MTANDISKRVRNIRKEKGLTQAELAHITHCSVQQISYIERGKRELSVKMAYALETALGVSHEYLLCKSDRKCRDVGDNIIYREDAVKAAREIAGDFGGWRAEAIIAMLRTIGKKEEKDDS